MLNVVEVDRDSFQNDSIYKLIKTKLRLEKSQKDIKNEQSLGALLINDEPVRDLGDRLGDYKGLGNYYIFSIGKKNKYTIKVKE